MKTNSIWLSLPLALLILASCGGSGKEYHQVQTLAEAKTLAAQNGTFIVIDFWRHG
jgi:hypothetical protein